MIGWRSTWSIYTRELMRFLRTAFQSVLAPVLTTALYFIVFGAAIGGCPTSAAWNMAPSSFPAC